MDGSNQQKNTVVIYQDAGVSTTEDQLRKLKYQLDLIERKEQAFRLRTAAVNEAKEDKAALLMEQIAYRLRNEEILMTKEDQARKIRMDEIHLMKTKLDQLLKAERIRKAKEGMTQEIFEEDAERMEFELTGNIEKLVATEEEKGLTPASDGMTWKRKTTPDEENQPQAKKRVVEVVGTAIEPGVGAAPDLSQTVPSSSMIPETVLVSQSTVSEATTELADKNEPKHTWSCGFCGRTHSHSVDRRGKDILCECSPRSRILWEVCGGCDEEGEQDACSEETVGGRYLLDLMKSDALTLMRSMKFRWKIE